ncbi:MAG: hypothetical protein HY731_11340 [Candidatus Tectomicrobia bacterium]|nr:hypothetical protein [Candidatus Tectomicrobia bacterium]
MKREGMLLRMMCSLFLGFLVGCGGGGGDGSSPSSSRTSSTGPMVQSGTPSTGSAVSAVQSAIGAINFGLGSMSGGGLGSAKLSLKSFKETRTRDLNASMAGFYSDLRDHHFKILSPLFALRGCSFGGSRDFSPTSTGFTATFTQCKEHFDIDGNNTLDVEEFVNGSVSFSETATGFSLTLTNLIDRITRISDGRLLGESLDNFSVTGTFGNTMVSCGGEQVPTSFTIVTAGTSSIKEDGNADGVLDFDDRGEANFTASTTVNQFNSTTCEPTDFTTTLQGSFAFTDNLDGSESFAMNISSSDPLAVTFKAVTVNPPSAAATGGVNVTVNGSFTVVTSCFSALLTVSTTTPLFFPDFTGEDEEVTCPISGVVRVTGGLIGTITYTSTGGVRIDNGSDGSVDEALESCRDGGTCM